MTNKNNKNTQRLALSADPFESSKAVQAQPFLPFVSYNALIVNGAKVMEYGSDNKFPANISDAISRSAVATRCMSVLESAVRGNGIELEGASRPSLGQTWQSLFNACVKDAILYRQFAIKFCMNLSGASYTFGNVPMQFLRVSPDHSTVSVALDWSRHQEVVTYPLYQGGTIDYGVGYVILFSDIDADELFYSYKAGSLGKACVSDASIQEFYSKNLNRGFQPQAMLTIPYTPDNFGEFAKKLRASYCGTENADKLMIVAGDGEQTPSFTAIPQVDLDKYQSTAKSVQDSIIAWFGTPRELLGFETSTGFSDGAEELVAKCAVWEKFTVSPIRTFVLDALNSLEDGFGTPHFNVEPLDIRSLFETGEDNQVDDSQELNEGDTIKTE